MNTLQIKYFLGVVDNGCNFTKTSQVFYVSQSALSQHINSLGNEFGVKLFDTTNKSAAKLTPGGKLLYQLLSEFNQTLRKTIIEARELNKMPAGSLKIACGDDWEMSDVLQKIDDFCSRYPDIHVGFDSVHHKIMYAGLKNNDYDITITHALEFRGKNEYNSFVIFENVPTVLIFSAKHKLAGKKKLRITDFKDEIFYVLSEDEKPLAKTVHEEYCKDNGFIPRFKEFSNIDSIYLALETGAGCTILDKMKRICNNSAYKWFELDLSINIGFVWKKTNNNPALRLFLNEVILRGNAGGAVKAKNLQCGQA
jgi:DNA-binding transcriptional LysR family regulator